MTTSRLVSQSHFLHIFAVIKIFPVKVEAIKKMKAIVDGGWSRWSSVSFFEGMENVRRIDW